jgi:serpin B
MPMPAATLPRRNGPRRSQRHAIRAALAVTLLLVLGLAAPPPTVDQTAGANPFAWDLYARLAPATQGNLFVSPLSIREAFGMLAEGARGETAAELQQAFHFPADDERRRTSLRAVRDWLHRPDAPYELEVANGVWTQDGFPVREAFLEAVQEAFAADAATLDFRGDSAGAMRQVNDWVSARTRGRIPTLFADGQLDADTRVVLANAVYFNGEWERRFDTANTTKQPFRTDTGPVQADMMRNTARFRYAEVDGVQALEMPYKGGNLSALFLLPRGSLAELERGLDAARVAAVRDAMREQQVEVHIPRFTFRHETDGLKDHLEALGVRQAFTRSADLSGIAGRPGDLLVSEVVPKTFVQLDERGTEAAAATGVVVTVTSMPPPPPVFRADRPFVFLIQDQASGLVLFLGRVADPTAA